MSKLSARFGFTLTELLVILAILSLVWTASIPGMTHLMARNLAMTNTRSLLGAIHFTRYQAVARQRIVTLCPMQGEGQCGGNWHEGLVSFVDLNANGRMDAEDRLLADFAPIQRGRLAWRSFRRRPWLQMTPLGTTNFQNGNFVYCNENQDPRYARQLVINLQGRARESRDTNGDGIVEDRQGQQLVCPRREN